MNVLKCVCVCVCLVCVCHVCACARVCVRASLMLFTMFVEEQVFLVYGGNNNSVCKCVCLSVGVSTCVCYRTVCVGSRLLVAVDVCSLLWC